MTMNRTLTDVNARERATLWPFVAAALIMGVAPLIWTRAIDGAAQKFVSNDNTAAHAIPSAPASPGRTAQASLRTQVSGQ